MPRLSQVLGLASSWHREIPENTVSLLMEKLRLPQGAHLICQVAGSSLGEVIFCSWKKVSLFQEFSSP